MFVLSKVGMTALQDIQINSRFLHTTRYRYVQKLLATFPAELDTVYLVNSGSEANDLALRMSRASTSAVNRDDVIVLDSAYHGHTQALVEISPYKWYQAVDGKDYRASTTHVVSCPDTYRGEHRGFTAAAGLAYAQV
jgi:ethanolamine-phosphate phospho-lyase